MKTILHLTLKKQWFDEIRAGVKKVEYREDKPYWRNRLFKHYDIVMFHNGYGHNAPTMATECKGIHLRLALKTEGHGAPDKRCFCIELGKILEVQI